MGAAERPGHGHGTFWGKEAERVGATSPAGAGCGVGGEHVGTEGWEEASHIPGFSPLRPRALPTKRSPEAAERSMGEGGRREGPRGLPASDVAALQTALFSLQRCQFWRGERLLPGLRASSCSPGKPTQLQTCSRVT